MAELTYLKFYMDSMSVLDEMSDEEAGKFIKAIFLHETTGKIPDEFWLKIAIKPFINQFVRDKKSYKEACAEKAEAAKTSWKKRKSMDNHTEPCTSIDDNRRDTKTKTKTKTKTIDKEEEKKESEARTPTFEEVCMKFLSNGGTQEMARKFYDTHTATGWMLRGSPIKNYHSLVSSYIEAWKKNDSTKTITERPLHVHRPGIDSW